MHELHANQTVVVHVSRNTTQDVYGRDSNSFMKILHVKCKDGLVASVLLPMHECTLTIAPIQSNKQLAMNNKQEQQILQIDRNLTFKFQNSQTSLNISWETVPQKNRFREE